ncbi:MAG TPA: hypothetical protein VMT67_04935 [Terriglobales bacterium]|nr:hypothetical protein [Terriglobales bacterium]
MADEAAESNATQPASPPARDVHGAEHGELLRAASGPGLTADQALALLDRADLPADVIEQLAKHGSALKLPKVKLALACHAHTPRHISVPLIRHFYTFDLMKVALSLVAPADVKLSAEEVLLGRLKMITAGERLTLARRASGRIAGALLTDADEKIMRAALENGRLTEALVIRAILRPEASAALVQTASQHAKWSYRRDVQLALLRTEHLSLARALAFSRELSAAHLADILRTSHLPSQIKAQLLNQKTQAKAATEAG